MARERKNTATEGKVGSEKPSDSKAIRTANPLTNSVEGVAEVMNEAELKSFLVTIRDKMSEGTCPAIFSLSSMNYVLNQPNIYEVMNKENKELARDVWLRIKQSGLQVKEPPMLFEAGV